MTTKDETIKYELSNDQRGLVRFCIAFDQHSEENLFTYHIHSDEMTRLEQWIYGFLTEQAGRRMPPALLPEERETGELRYPLAPNVEFSGAVFRVRWNLVFGFSIVQELHRLGYHAQNTPGPRQYYCTRIPHQRGKLE